MSTSSIHDYQAKALELKIDTRIIEDDRNFISDLSGKIFYAIDTNVLDLYTDPAKRAQAKSGKRKIGTGDTFPGESPQLKQQITRQIGVYLFTSLTEDNLPLITLPHSREDVTKYTYSLLNQIEMKANKAKKEIKEIINEYIKNNIDLNQQIQDEENSKIKIIAEQVNELLDTIYNDSSPKVQYTRLIKLLKKKLIVDSHVYADRYCNEPKYHKLKHLLKDNYSILDKITLSEKKKHWLKNIHSVIGSPEDWSEIKLERNAWILAKIEFINEKLPQEQKLVFITNNTVIIDTANKYDITFADKYVRRPKQFLSSIYDQLFSHLSNNNKTNTFGQLLQLFLTDLDCKDDDNTQRLRALLDQRSFQENSKPTSDNDNHFTQDILDKWTDFNQLYPSDQLSGEEQQIKVQYPELNRQRDLLAFLKRLSQQIDQEVRNAWEALYETGTSANYFYLGSAHQLTRLPPPAVFTRFKQTRLFLIDIILKKEVVNYEKLSDFEQVLNHDCDNNSISYKYLHSVAYSVLYSTSGHNLVALTLAKRALTFIEEKQLQSTDKTDQTAPSGREAHFLIAYNTRIVAKNNNDLQPAFTHLELSKQRLQAGVILHGYNYDELKLRLDAEELSLHLCCHLFKVYCNENHNVLQQKTPWTLEKYIQKSDSTMEALTQSLIEHRQSRNPDPTDYLSKLNSIATFSVACDFLTLSLLTEEFITQERLNKCLECFDLSYPILKNYELSISPLSHCLFYYSKVISAETYDEREKYKKKALDLDIQGYSQARYESKRISALREKIKNYGH